MARKYSAALLLGLAAGLTGCGTQARFVQHDQSGGVVAVPQSSLFQWWYRNDAIAYIRDNNPGVSEDDIEIVNEQEVPVGQQSRTDQRNFTRQVDRNGQPIGDVNGTTTTTTTTELKEYQITYRLKPKSIGNMPVTTKVLPAGSNTAQNRAMNGNGIMPAGGQRPMTPTSLDPNMQPTTPMIPGPGAARQ